MTDVSTLLTLSVDPLRDQRQDSVGYTSSHWKKCNPQMDNYNTNTYSVNAVWPLPSKRQIPSPPTQSRKRPRLDQVPLQDVHTQNIQARQYNRRLYELNHLDAPLIQLQKSVSGLGIPLVCGKLDPDLPALDVGDFVPPTYFPATISAVRRMKFQDINCLSMLVNDSFGIYAGESIDVMRHKVLSWLIFTSVTSTE